MAKPGVEMPRRGVFRALASKRIPSWMGVLVAVLLAPGVALAQQQRDSVFATQSQFGILELRLERIERILDAAALTDMVQSMDALAFELRQLRGRIEGLENELQSLRARQRDQFRNMDERVSLLEGGSWIPPVDEATVGVSDPFDFREADVQSRYEEAFERLMAGDYPSAIRRFETFLEAHPDNLWAANALYWLAEARYATGDFHAARQDFLALRQRHSESDKRGDALLKIGFAEIELGNAEAAIEILQEVVQTYPGTVLSRLAQERLRRLQGS